MRLNARIPHLWFQLNEQLQKSLGSPTRLLVYRNFNQAVFETLLGLHLRFPSKKKWLSQLGFGDHTRAVQMELAKFGARMESLDPNQVLKDGSLDERSLLAFVHDLDDSLTGELYDHIENLQVISKTRVPRIHLAHHLYLERPSFINRLSDVDIVIAGVDESLAMVFLSEKMSYPLLGAQVMNWHLEQDLVDFTKRAKRGFPTFEDRILKFEAQLPSGLSPWFKGHQQQRLFDRSLISVEHHDGLAFIEMLSEMLEIPLGQPGENCLLETASFSRWRNPVWLEQAERLGRTPEDLRGLVMIHGSLINGDLTQKMMEALKELKQLST